jgi:hypothetical protein
MKTSEIFFKNGFKKRKVNFKITTWICIHLLWYNQRNIYIYTYKYMDILIYAKIYSMQTYV